jgi:multiple sugar transport system substrate-binding protein
MRRREFLQALLAGGSLALAGCGSTSTTTSSGPVMLTIPNDKGSWEGWINSIGQYMRDHYQIGFKSQPYTDTTVYQGVIRSAVQTSKAPAIFTWWSGYQTSDLVQAGALADLTSQMQDWIKNRGVSADVARAFQVNGRYYGAPFNIAYWIVFYNKHVFDRYNLQPPKTWDDFMALNATLKGQGVTPLSIYSQDSWTGFIWFENLLINSDPDLYENLMVGKASYTDPGVVKVMQLWKSLADKGYFSTPLNTSNPPTQFAKGEIAMNLMGQWAEANLSSVGMKAGVDYDAFIMPPITPNLGPQVIFETGPIVVGAHSPQMQDGIKALNAFMQPDVQKQWVNMTSFVSAETTVPANNDLNTRINQQITSRRITLHNRFWEATPSDIATQASADLVQFILHPDSYMQVLQNCNTVAQQYWSTHK